MKVNSTFSPITITIESRDELDHIIRGLHRSLEFSRKSWSLLCGSYKEDYTDHLIKKLASQLEAKG